MKIAVWILSEYQPQTGGGFSLYDKMIQLIDDYKFSDEIEVCFVGHNAKSNYHFRKEYICINSLPFHSKTIVKYSHKINFLNNRECEILKKNNIDLIYYPVQGFKKINNFPFAVANWDIGHLSSFAFPEVAMNGTFEYREKWYSRDIYKALMVFAESEAGKQELLNLTKLNPERIGIVPLIPGGVVEVKVSDAEQSSFLSKSNLEAQQYFFYPAQFWAHKNHYNLLLAFKEIVNEFPQMKLVFTGSDKGNKTFIQEVVNKLSLQKNVLFTGFISNEELCTLYRNATAMVMPSFYGSTNMPLIEARELNCPVLCSDLAGHREMMKDGAIYFNALDHQSIYNSMKSVLNVSFRDELLSKAQATIKDSIFESAVAIKSLEENFIRLKAIRMSWGQNDKIF